MDNINLIVHFEWYLLFTFVLSLAIRYQLYRTSLTFFWSMPEKWPAMYKVIKKHSRSLLKWTTLIPVGIMLAIYLIHMISYRIIWKDADIAPPDLIQSWMVLLPIAVLLLAMLYYDFKSLFQISTIDFAQIESDLGRGELALNPKLSKWVRRLSFRKVDPEKIVEDRVVDTIDWLEDALLYQLRYQSFHTVVRIAFGFLLWTSWARLKLNLSLSLYLVSLVSLAAMMAFAWRWTREPKDGARKKEVIDESVGNLD